MDRDVLALIRFIDSRQALPHAWGREANDCVGYSLSAAEAATGVRTAPDISWSDRKGALRVLQQFGSLEAGLDAYFERVLPAFAVRGDIAGVPDAEFGVHPMIVEGELLVGPGERGNRRMPRRAMDRAWSITKLKA